MKSIKVVVIAVFFMAAMCIKVYAGEGSASNLEEKPLSTAEAAIAKALAYSGFDKADGFDGLKSAKAELVVIENDNTPFMVEKINGKNMWRVSFKNIPVGQGSTIIIERDFEVTLDPETGKLIKIFSISDEVGSADTLPQPSAEAAELFFEKGGLDFRGLPDKMCNVTFWESLQRVQIASPSVTKIIKAYYWDIAGRLKQYPPAWLIIFRGIANPLPNAGPVKSPDWANNFMMTIIDAEKGKSVCAITAPYDEDDFKKRSQEK